MEMKPVNETQIWMVYRYGGNTNKCFHQQNAKPSQICNWEKKKRKTFIKEGDEGLEDVRRNGEKQLGHSGVED